MWSERIPLSILAGVLTPFAIFGLNAAFGGFAGLSSSSGLRLVYVLTALLVALAVSLLRPISPWVYGVTVSVAFGLVPFVAVAVTHSQWGNLGALAVFFAIGFGLLVGVPVAVIGSLLRLLRLPHWTPIAPAGAALCLSGLTQVMTRTEVSDQSIRIISVMKEIRQAEIAYAAGGNGRGYTCNGPDLRGLTGIEWSANTALGTPEKNVGQTEGHWIFLQCDASAHPKSFNIRAIPSGGGAEIALDSAGHFSRPSRSR